MFVFRIPSARTLISLVYIALPRRGYCYCLQSHSKHRIALAWYTRANTCTLTIGPMGINWSGDRVKMVPASFPRIVVRASSISVLVFARVTDELSIYFAKSEKRIRKSENFKELSKNCLKYLLSKVIRKLKSYMDFEIVSHFPSSSKTHRRTRILAGFYSRWNFLTWKANP